MARQARRGGESGARAAGSGLLALVAALTAGCDGKAAPSTAAEPYAARLQPPPLTAEALAGDHPPAMRDCALLIVDQDAGAALPEGGRAGALLVVNAEDLVGGPAYLRPAIPAGKTAEDVLRQRISVTVTDPRWVEPCDALQLPDGSWLVLESKWAPNTGDARGAIFRLTGFDATPELWWTDARTRQPVCFVRDAEGTILVSDRDADPDGVRAAEPDRQRTGCVFGISVGADGRPARTEVVAAGRELFTPGALLAIGPLLFLMDADANPRGLKAADGRLATPGVLFDLVRTPGAERLARRRLDVLVEAEVTTSPIGLIARNCEGEPAAHKRPPPPTEWPGLGPEDSWPAWLPEIYLVDANFGTSDPTKGDGGLFWVQLGARSGHTEAHGLEARLVPLLDPQTLPAHTLVDPAYGCTLPDGRLAIADASADPLHLGLDGTGKGVYGSGHGAVFAWDPGKPGTVSVLVAGEQLVTPVAVRAFTGPPPHNH